jgi:hypothetical protein
MLLQFGVGQSSLHVTLRIDKRKCQLSDIVSRLLRDVKDGPIFMLRPSCLGHEALKFEFNFRWANTRESHGFE